MSQDQPEKAERVIVEAVPGSRLEELLSSYEPLKAAAEEAKSRYEAVTDAIKAELSCAHPGAAGMLLTGAPGLPRLAATWRQPWRFDTKRFKEDQPYLYVQYASNASGHWDLRAL